MRKVLARVPAGLTGTVLLKRFMKGPELVLVGIGTGSDVLCKPGEL